MCSGAPLLRWPLHVLAPEKRRYDAAKQTKSGKKMTLRNFCFALALMWAANSQANELCTSMQKKDGKVDWVRVPCSTFDRPIPCSKYTPDGKGRVLIEDRPCLPGEQKTVQA